MRARALDLVQSSVIAKTSSDTRAVLHWELPIELTDTVALRTIVAGTGTASVGDTDQGGELERLARQLFEFLCPFGTFHSPQVTYGKKRRRELCDILAVARIRETPDEGLFVVQSKVSSVTEETLGRKAERTAASIYKNILIALGQVEGAVRRLRAGDPIYRKNGTRVEDDPDIAGLKALVQPMDLKERAGRAGHGIVLISEMHEGVDWTEVATRLIESHTKLAFMTCVLDLQEIQRLVVLSDGRPAIFEAHLTRRFGLIKQHGSANVRTEVKEE